MLQAINVGQRKADLGLVKTVGCSGASEPPRRSHSLETWTSSASKCANSSVDKPIPSHKSSQYTLDCIYHH